MLRRVSKLILEKKQFIIYILLRVMVMFLTLTTNIFIVRKLTTYDYGVFSLVTVVTSFVTTFGFSWSSSSILYYGSKERAISGSINKTFWARNIIIFTSLILVTIIFILFRNQINTYIGIEISFLILFWLYVSVAEDYLNQYFLVVKKQILSSLLSVTAKVIYLILVLSMSFDVKTLVILNIISHATVLLYIFAISKKDVSKFELDKSWLKELFMFSLWQLFGFSGVYLLNFGDTAVINYFMEPEDVAVYNVGYTLYNGVSAFANIFIGFFASQVSQFFIEKDKLSLRNFFFKDRFLILAASIFVHCILMVFAHPIITNLFGTEYIESVSVFRVLLIGSVAQYINVFYVLYYNTNNKYRVLQVVNIIKAIGNITLDIWLIRLFGVIGPAIATTLVLILTSIFSFLYCENDIRKHSTI